VEELNRASEPESERTGAMALTSCARFAIRTQSQFLMKMFR